MIEERLYQHLVDHVPSLGGRVYANIMEQDTTKPALVYVIDSERIDGGITCDDPDITTVWELYLYGEGYLTNKQIKDEIRAALSAFDPQPTDWLVEDAVDVEGGLFTQIIHFKTQE